MLELQGENPFRCRAYHNAAEALKSLPNDLHEMVASGKLGEIAGIGETMLAKISQLVASGHLPAYDELKRQTPPGLFALLRVPGLGPKKIKTLREDLKITSLADLRSAAEAGKIAALKGFGAKTEAKVLEGIRFIEAVGDRILLSDALRLVTPILKAIREHPKVIRAEPAGSLRRRRETIGDLDIVFSSKAPHEVLDDFVRLPEVAQVLVHGPTKASVRLAEGVQCDARGVLDDQFAFALHYFTGSKNHNIAMRRRAIAQGLKLNEYALEGDSGSVPCKSEADLFKALGLDFIPPELREDLGEIELAETHKLPKLIELDDLKGTFHCHTDWSDGAATLEAMVEAAQAQGLTYLGIADHSKSAGYARGLSIDRVHDQWKAIDALNAKLGKSFRVYKGTECDILPDGSLDYPDDVLEGFDYVVASVHSSFGLSREAMTDRIVRAIEHPLVTMLGHPTGRLLLTRDQYEVDLDRVIAAAADRGVIIEINANPHRLDLDDLHARSAKDRGVTIAINPDAHATDGFEDLAFGVSVARRAGLTAKDIFNTQDRAHVDSALAKRRR